MPACKAEMGHLEFDSVPSQKEIFKMSKIVLITICWSKGNDSYGWTYILAILIIYCMTLLMPKTPIFGLNLATKPPLSVASWFLKLKTRQKHEDNKTKQTKGKNSGFLCSKLPWELFLMAVWSIENQSFSP